MQTSRIRLSPVIATLSVALALGLTACGGDDEPSDSGSSSDAPAAQEESKASGTPALDSVLTCLTDAGVAAKDQTSNTSGETIGIDYPGGRTVLSFEETEDDAKLTESVQPDPTADVYREGLIVVSAATDPAAEADKPSIETCIKG